jgi:hypothetical protein
MLLLFVAVAICLLWARDHRRLSLEIEQLRNPPPEPYWDVDQVLGPPNTTGAGDIPTAWASKTPDDSDEWLLLEYDRAVVATAVVVHETYNPGAVVKVSAFRANGEEVVAWTGVDPTPRSLARGESVIPISLPFKTRRIKVYIDSKSTPGWNEIDAVGLRHGKGAIQWATHAEASSSYGRNASAPSGRRYVIDVY